MKRLVPRSRILLVDRLSTDSTVEIARSFGADVRFEDQGLGFARQLCFNLANTKYLAFVDSDVEIARTDFFSMAEQVLLQKRFGAVIGLAVGHRFAYGLPASLLVLRKADFRGNVIPKDIDGRETHYIQRRLDALNLKPYYVHDSIYHHSAQRKFMPEYQGAYTRLLPSPAIKEILFSLKVITLRAMNSRSAKNLLYVPIFSAKFLRGFSNPKKWIRTRSVRGV